MNNFSLRGTFLMFFFLLAFSAMAKLKVVTTTSVFADFIQNIGGTEQLEVKYIVPMGQDPHTYQLTDNDKILLNAADIIFKNGLQYEMSLDDFLKKNTVKAVISVLSDGVTPFPNPKSRYEKDPHAWMSTYNALFYIHNIKKTLINVDASNSMIYEKSYDTYRSALVRLEEELFTFLNKLPMYQRTLITNHRGFAYFARAYNLQTFTLLDIAEEEISSDAFRQLRKQIRVDSVAVFFGENTLKKSNLETFGKEMNCKIGADLYVDALGDAQSPAPTYLQMMRYDAQQIFEGLKEQNTAVSPPSIKETLQPYWWIIFATVLAVAGVLFWHFKRGK
jgi:manganese/iron transport system substrate-binding protein